jgi:hypothetical protein
MNIICKENNIRLIIHTKDECDKFKLPYNCAFSSTNEIEINFFNLNNNLELMLIAFFHEFAHLRLRDKCFSTNISTMQYELNITFLGIKFAKEKYNILFSDDAVNWLVSQAFTYKNQLDKNYIIINSFDENSYKLQQKTFTS